MQHARLSASGAHRWLNSPGSVAAEQGLKGDFSSIAANEGSAAHELAEMCFVKNEPARYFIGQTLPENNAFTVPD